MATNYSPNWDEPDGPSIDQSENNIRIPADAVPYYKLARKIGVNLVKAQQHDNYLNQCILRSIVPKGLSFKVKAQIPEPDWKFQLRWDQAQLECSKKLRDLLKEYYYERVTELQTRYITTFEEIEQRCHDPTVINKMKELINKLKDSVEKGLTERKNQKIEDSRNTRRNQEPQPGTSATFPQNN